MPTPRHRTECVSFPRSGHHLLEGILLRYFGEQELRYCEQYSHPEKRLDLDPTTRFQKNHDLDLDTLIRSDRRYLVQIRYPFDSLVSLFKLDVAAGSVADSPGAWTTYAIHKASYWMRFYRKWVLDHIEPRMIVNYSDLVADPVGMVANIVSFMGDDAPDLDRIRAACAVDEIRQRNDYHNFKHYGAQFFDLLRGLFSAVPGVDVKRDRLVVPDMSSVREMSSMASRLRDMEAEIGKMAWALSQAMKSATTESPSCAARPALVA